MLINLDLTTTGVCPKCKVGKLIERYSRKGNPFFGCSIFRDCKYIHDKNEYYDVIEKKWVFYSGS